MRRVWACLIALALTALYPSLRVLADTTVFSDDCITGATTALIIHTPDIGTSWAIAADNTSGASIWRCNASDWAEAAASTPSGGIHYTADGANFTNGYVTFTTLQINDNSTDDFWYLKLRIQDASNFIGCGWYAAAVANDTFCFKYVAGVYTTLTSGNADCGFIDGSVVKVTVTGDTITIQKDGAAACVTATGANAIAGAGDTGFGMGNLKVSTDDVTTGQGNWTDYIAVSQDAAAARPPSLGLLGVGE